MSPPPDQRVKWMDADLVSGAWLVLPTYMIYVMGRDILDAFAIASRTKDE